MSMLLRRLPCGVPTCSFGSAGFITLSFTTLVRWARLWGSLDWGRWFRHPVCQFTLLGWWKVVSDLPHRSSVGILAVPPLLLMVQWKLRLRRDPGSVPRSLDWSPSTARSSTATRMCLWALVLLLYVLLSAFDLFLLIVVLFIFYFQIRQQSYLYFKSIFMRQWLEI